jgi:addiction module HigA family antidote
MAAQKNRYNPDYATPPGWLLEAELEALGISKGEFARRCGCSAREIKKIIAGEAPIGPQMAIQIARISGGGPDIWLRMESNYRLRSAQLAEMATSPQYAEWVKRFPTAELAARDAIDEPESVGNTAAQLLAFFGFATLDEWRAEHATAKNAYRYSTAFDGDEAVLATWLQFGEIEAVYTKCPDYDEAVFMQSLHKIRSLTAAGTDDCLPEAQRLCQQSGVILAFVEPLAQLDISGAAWWFSLTKAVIQLDPRHETDELLWASFFHGAAHILLHDKEGIFIDLPGQPEVGKTTPEDAEADAWASDFLAPPDDWRKFTASRLTTEEAVRQFAERQGIAPGIVVGRLQHEGLLPGNCLNGLKRKLRWTKPEE